jgi:hypothetical protein
LVADRWGPVVGRLPPPVFELDSEPEYHRPSFSRFPGNLTRTRQLEAINRSHRSSSFRFSSKPWTLPQENEV